MAKASRSEIHPFTRRPHQPSPLPPYPPSASARGLIGQEGHHEILQQSLGLLDLDVDPARRIGRLLQKHGIAGQLGDVDGDGEALAGEDGVHERDILVRQIARHGHDQDAGDQRGWLCCCCCCGGGGGGKVVGSGVGATTTTTGRIGGRHELLLVYVGQGQGEGARDGRGRGQGIRVRGREEPFERREEGALDVCEGPVVVRVVEGLGMLLRGRGVAAVGHSFVAVGGIVIGGGGTIAGGCG